MPTRTMTRSMYLNPRFGKVKHSREFIITTDGYVRDGPLDEISAMCAEILETGENLLGYLPGSFARLMT